MWRPLLAAPLPASCGAPLAAGRNGGAAAQCYPKGKGEAGEQQTAVLWGPTAPVHKGLSIAPGPRLTAGNRPARSTEGISAVRCESQPCWVPLQDSV